MSPLLLAVIIVGVLLVLLVVTFIVTGVYGAKRVIQMNREFDEEWERTHERLFRK